MCPGKPVKTVKVRGLNWAGENETAAAGEAPGVQIQRPEPPWRMNTSTGPNGVCAEAEANAAGSVTWESRCSAAYLAG
jgi:hypothetical protein